LVSFAVPDYGILFRSVAEGARTDLETIALFSLLRFASHNKDIFLGRELLIHTDYRLLAYLMDGDRATAKNPGTFRKEAKRIAGDIVFRVKTISDIANRATGPACDIPTLPADSRLKINAFSSLNIRKPPNPFSIGPDSKSR